MLYCSIDENISQASVEIEVLLIKLPLSIRWNEAYICDTSDVLACLELIWVMEHKGVENGNKQGTLSPGSLVGYSKVGDYSNACSTSDNAALSYC